MGNKREKGNTMRSMMDSCGLSRSKNATIRFRLSRSLTYRFKFSCTTKNAGYKIIRVLLTSLWIEHNSIHSSCPEKWKSKTKNKRKKNLKHSYRNMFSPAFVIKNIYLFWKEFPKQVLRVWHKRKNNEIRKGITFSWNRPSAMINTSCCRGLHPDGRRALVTATSSVSLRYFNRSTTGSSVMLFSCLNVKLEIICTHIYQTKKGLSVCYIILEA